MYKIDKSATETIVQVMALKSGRHYGKVPNGDWITGTKRQLVEAGATGIKSASGIRVERTYL